MKTLRSILSILLVVLFIPSPTVWANSVSSAMRARNAAAAAGAAASNPTAPAGGTTSAGSQAYSMAQEAHRRARVAADAMDQMRRAQIEARLINAPIPNPNRSGQNLPGVPDGIGSGGLDALNPEDWIGAVRQGNGDRWIVETKDGRKVVTIRQDAAQALLTWRSFNIGQNTTLYFDQRAGGGDSANWTAFNFISDSSTAPSQILGQMKAEGQVYVVNPNGIVFGNNSQVDVRGLTASALPINRQLVEGGLLNNPNAQFLFSGLDTSGGSNGASSSYGNVLVMAGAQLRSTISAEGNGGRIMLVGANVENHGMISTPGGQAILAAGLQVGVAAHSSSDASLRGLDVFVGKVGADSGHVLNQGLIESMLGNTTMVGKTVEMNGIIASSTSVALNGRIDLIAAYDAQSNPLKENVANSSLFLNSQSGTVLIGADSLLAILPELASTEKVAATELALRSQLNIRGKDIYFGERSMVLVPSGIINANAGVWRIRTVNANSEAEFINADGQIYLDKDVLISAAGTTDVYIPLSQVLLTVELRGSELADSPVQRDDILRGETITVDIRNRGTLNGVDWVGSPLADVSGYLGLIERTVAELTMDGGTVNLNAGGTVVMQKGSKVDVSGGFARYQGGVVETTALYKDGRIISIADALPNISYDGILSRQVSDSSVRWANSRTYTRSQMIGGNSYQDTYIEGAAGGSLSVIASAMALDGEMVGSVVVGDRQRVRVPDYASLLLAFETRDIVTETNQARVISPNAPSITFVNGAVDSPLAGPFVAGQGKGGAALPDERVEEVALSVGLLGEGGFGDVTVRNREGSITVGEGVAITGPTKGALKLEGANVTIDGSIKIAGGLIDLSAYNISYDTINQMARSNTMPNPLPAAGRGKVEIGEKGRLNTAGEVIVDAPDAEELVASYAIDGGKVSVRGYKTVLHAKSEIDVSGGAHLSTAGKLSYGNGGAIVLEGGRDLVLDSVINGSLVIDGTLKGYAAGRGGSLSLLAPVVEVGHGGAYAGMRDAEGNPRVNSLVLDSDFFNKGGFSDFTVRGIGTSVDGEFIAGVRIDDGAKIDPQVEGRIGRINEQGLSLVEQTYPEGVRTPVSLTFGATGANNTRGAMGERLMARSEVIMEEGAHIKTDAGGRVSFNANAISLHGKVETPAGSITVSGGERYDQVTETRTGALTTVFIGKTAELLATGKLVELTDAQGLKHSTVHGGGVITLEGNIVAEAGALLDVSGISAEVAVLDSYNPDGPVRQRGQGKRGYTTLDVDSSGGTIRLKGSEMLVSEATLRGAAGGANASGGTLEVSSGRYYAPAETTSTADITLSVLQEGALIGAGERGVGKSVQLADNVLGAGETGIAGRGFFTIESFSDNYVDAQDGTRRLESGGFDNLHLAGNVEFVNNKISTVLDGDGNLVDQKKIQIDARGAVHVARGGVLTSRNVPVAGEPAGIVPTIEINAKHVVIGQDLALPRDPATEVWYFERQEDAEVEEAHRITPVSASGKLNVNADSIDIGTIVLDRLSTANLNASDNGAIRGSGHLSIAGDITFKAGQIHPTTATEFSIVAADYIYNAATRQMEAHGRSVTFIGGNSNLALPYSAGGTLSVYGGNIRQDGVLRSPFGIINLGWDGTGAAPVGAVSGLAVPVTSSVTLGGGSVTSVSGVGPDGKGVVMPYGILRNGISWIDPRGVDITHGGLPQKQVNISGKDVVTSEGSLIDLRGGGDLFAYRWVPGIGGSRDVLSLPGSFAVMPNYDAPASAPYNPESVDGTLGTDKGYTDSNLKVGDRIYLSGNSGLAAGYYTLLPARYALMEGAFLVTPKAGDPFGNGASILQADGSHLVSGYRVNGFSGTAQDGRILSRFEVANRKVVMERAQYDLYSANDFLAAAAADRGVSAPRLPGDSGQVVFTGSRSMELDGTLVTKALGKGRGSLVDINSALDIVIGGSSGAVGSLHLDTDTLNAFSAASLLIGGVRSTADGYVQVNANSGNVTVDNAGSPLVGSDIILVGRDSVVLSEGAQIASVAAEGAQASAELIRIGSTNLPGNGALVRVSSATQAPVERVNVTDGNTARLTVQQGAQVSGGSVTLDSSSQTQIDPQVQLRADTLNLGSGRISLVLDEAATLPANGGLVLSGSTLDSILASVRSLGFSSYSSIDVYGSGTVGAQSVEQIALNAPVLRAYQTNGGAVQFTASTLLLGNAAGKAGAIGTLPADGTLHFNADEVRFGSGVIGVDGFARTTLAAKDAVRLVNEGGISVAGDLHVAAPAITAGRAAKHMLYASGDFLLERGNAGAAKTAAQGDVGASLVIDARSVALRSDIVLPAGKLEVRSRAGDITLGSADGMRIDVSGNSRNIYDRTIGTDAGSVQLTAVGGNVVVGSGSLIDVSAGSDKNRVGSVGVSAVDGALILDGGKWNAGTDAGGMFTLDALRLANAAGNTTASVGALDAFLNEGGFGGSRSYRLRSGDAVIDGVANAHHYTLSTDAGSVRVSGQINASGATGGQIELRASNDVIIENGGVLSAVGDDFNNAGKGGKVFLEAGSLVDGNINRDARVSIREGSLIDLGVKTHTEASAAMGRHSGVLHLRAARNLAGTDFGVDVIAGAVRGASHIAAEGFEVYDLSNTGGTIAQNVRDAVLNDGKAFLGSVGGNMQDYDNMLERISGGNEALKQQIILQVGAEIVNHSGDLNLGAADSRNLSFWDLSGYRFGRLGSAGVLTLRAAGDIGIYDALSDGFVAPAGATDLRLSELSVANANLPTNAQSWSYRIVSGADLSAADFRQTQALDYVSGEGQTAAEQAQHKGSVLIGRNTPPVSGSSTNSLVYLAGQHYRYQVIRTGTGDIDIVSARDVRLLNPFATIYTAGTRVANPTVLPGGTFGLPQLTPQGALPQGNLGTRVDAYAVQYSLSGGDVAIETGGDVVRYIRDNAGKLHLDTGRQLPNNWLYRRGHVDGTGNYGAVSVRQSARIGVDDPNASTTWWIDFSNFFQGVGALGGGNVSLVAGNDITNVDAVVPTNARAPMGVPDASKIVELGGGDLLVQAGRNIDGGIYYVERGQGSLLAGGSIKTNKARSISLGNLSVGGGIANPEYLPESTWMPTTLFLGKGSFDVSAAGDLLLGPVANTFLLPQGLGNRYWYKTYFSTYAPDSEVRVSSTAGNITLRGEVTLPSSSSPSAPGAQSFLQAWLSRQNQQTETGSVANAHQPWLGLAEASVAPFATMLTVMPPALRMAAYSGDVNVSGSFNLFPSHRGTLDVVAAGSIHALNPNGVYNNTQTGSTATWNSSRINVSDANPNFLPGVINPASYYSIAGVLPADNNKTEVNNMPNINRFFEETGSTNTVLQTKQALHSADVLHRNDKDPVYLYAGSGDISGLTLYSPKQTRVIAGRDITNIDFYMQNLASTDVSLIAAGRDIVAYDANSERRLRAIAPGNAFNSGVATALGGDIQLGGPGTLQVLAGRNLNLGVGPSGQNGLSSGVTTIGNRRNPFLSTSGADIIAGAGIGPSMGIEHSDLDFAAFVSLFLNASSASESTVAAQYQASFNKLLGLDRKGMYSNVRGLFDSESLPSQLSLARAIYEQARANGDLDPSVIAEPVDAATLAAFADGYLNPEAYSDKTPGYLGSLQAMMGVTDGDITWMVFNRASEQERLRFSFDMFYAVLRDVGRDYNNPQSPNYGKYDNGYLAIKTLFPQPAQGSAENGAQVPSRWAGDISLTSRQFKTVAGGNISLFAPGGGVVVGLPVADARPDQGILTEAGGNINIFTHNSVEVGSSRIFTLRGGDIAIWSSEGDIAAGSAAKTVRSAPPTRVVIDSQTASVLTDLSGLATGGGIGALQTVKDAAASDIDLIAPRGTVDAGDAGIRVSGNVNIAAEVVLNATNISSAGTAAGVPPAATAMPTTGLDAASSASQAATATMGDSAVGARAAGAASAIPSVFSIEVLGYGEEDEEDKRSAQAVPAQQEQAKSAAPLI